MKESYNVLQRIAVESKTGFISFYHIDRDEQFYKEAARFSIDFCKNDVQTIYSQLSEEESCFETLFMMSSSLFASTKKNLHEGEYVFVVKTQSRIRIATERCYNPIVDTSEEGDPRREFEKILGKIPQFKIETLLDVSF